jgi:hypothetical protein
MAFESGHKKLGGRQMGVPNKKTIIQVDVLLLESGINPIQKLVEIAESVESTIDQKINCYKEIAKYTYPKLKSQEVQIDQEAMNLRVQFVE